MHTPSSSGNFKSRSSHTDRFTRWPVSFFTIFLILIGPQTLWSGPSFQDVFEPEIKNFNIKIAAMPGKESVRRGDRFRLHVVATLTEGWHIYSLKAGSDNALATRIELDPVIFSPAGDWQESRPQITDDAILQKKVKTHSRRAEFSRLLAVPSNLPPGNYPLSGTLTYRSCDNTVCTIPQTIRFQSHVIVLVETEKAE